MPMLSAVMPVYNTAKFLARSIDSVLNQAFEDFELILVNDGSTDNSLDICKEFEKKDRRIVVIDQENKGAGAARNAGLAKAQGKYVVFPDSDDWIEPDAYEFCIKKMEENQLDLLLFGSINTIYDDAGVVISETKGAVNSFLFLTQEECRENWSECIANLPMGGPSNKVYRRSIITEYNITFPDIRRMQDGVFNILYYSFVERFLSVDKFYYHFTAHSAAYQRKKIPKDYLECAILYHKTAIEMLESWGLNVKKHTIVFDSWFSETVIDAMHKYTPVEDASFFSTYRYIRSIVCHAYIHEFYKEYLKDNMNTSKSELAIKNKWVLLLTLDVLRK